MRGCLHSIVGSRENGDNWTELPKVYYAGLFYVLHDAPIFRHRVNTLERIRKEHLHHMKPCAVPFLEIMWILFPFRTRQASRSIRMAPRAHDLRALPSWNFITSICRMLYNCPPPNTTSK